MRRVARFARSRPARLCHVAASRPTTGRPKSNAAAMAESLRVKVLVVGPAKCGKTRVANYLSDFGENPDLEKYVPTAGKSRARALAPNGGGGMCVRVPTGALTVVIRREDPRV